MKYRYEGRLLFIGDVEVCLPIKIKKVLVSQDVLFVLVDDGLGRKYGDHSLDRNIYAFNRDAVTVWQVQPVPHGGPDQPKPYIDIQLEGGQLVGHNWIGVAYSIDTKTGEVIASQSHGRPW